MYNENNLKAIAAEARKGAFEIIKKAESGHLGACSSSAELMTGLYFGNVLRYNVDDSKDPDRDRVLVRGHLGPLRYKIFSMLGWVPEEDLMTYRSLGSRLQGHEDMNLVPGVDLTPSGSLGMGLSFGVGCAIAAKNMGKNYRTFCFLGDGEEQEGSIGEAARHAANINLDNLVCILDQNGKQLSRPTYKSDNHSDVRKIWEGYGWDVKEIIDGHDFKEIMPVYEELENIKQPTFIIARTIKGNLLEGCLENICGYHTISSCGQQRVQEAINQLSSKVKKYGYNKELVKKLAPISERKQYRKERPVKKFNIKKIKRDSLIDSLFEYSKAVCDESIAKDLRVYAMTADLIRSDQVSELGFDSPVNYIDVGIREQHMIGVAHGISSTDLESRVYLNQNDAFLYRAADQLHACAQGGSNIILVSDDGGLSGGKNGSTHQSSGQPGCLITMPGIKLLEPADSIDFGYCLDDAFSNNVGPVYIRMHSAKFKPLDVGDRNTFFYITYDTVNPDLTIVSSGMPVIPATNAAKILEDKGVRSRVINVVDMKSLDETFSRLVEPNRPLFTFYNGNETILSSRVSNALLRNPKNIPSKIISHGFDKGTSGSIQSLLNEYGFDEEGIKNKILRHIE